MNKKPAGQAGGFFIHVFQEATSTCYLARPLVVQRSAVHADLFGRNNQIQDHRSLRSVAPGVEAFGVAHAIGSFEGNILHFRILVAALEHDFASGCLIRVEHPGNELYAISRNDSHVDGTALYNRRGTTLVVDGLVEGVAAAYHFAFFAASSVKNSTKRGHDKKIVGEKRIVIACGYTLVQAPNLSAP